MNGRQAKVLVAGGAARLTYRSASPDPPLIENTTVSIPAGTSITQNCCDPVAPEMFDTGTPSVSGAVLPIVTVTEALAECCTAPEVPVTVKLVVAAVALDPTARVSVALAPAVTVAGENVPVTPAGSPDTLSAIDCELPFSGVVETVYVPLAPCAIACDEGETAMLKSGGSVPVIVSATVVTCVALGAVPVTVSV